jgi:hypothetical protein
MLMIKMINNLFVFKLNCICINNLNLRFHLTLVILKNIICEFEIPFNSNSHLDIPLTINTSLVSIPFVAFSIGKYYIVSNVSFNGGGGSLLIVYVIEY